MKLFLLISLLPLLSIQQCYNENNQPVNWFIAIRIPNTKPRNYKILDSLSLKFRETSEEFLIDFLGRYNPSEDQLMAWSDQPPRDEDQLEDLASGSSSTAHSKGLIGKKKMKKLLFFWFIQFLDFLSLKRQKSMVKQKNPASMDRAYFVSLLTKA